jgi:type II secretory pathway component PulK
MNNSKKENGYVLVVIIGILTILSLMTITFATLSRIETRATRNYTDSVKCEKIAKAALEHAIYEIRLDKFGTDTLAYNDDDNGNYGLDENFDSAGASWPGYSVFPDTGTDDYDNDGNGADDSTWIYFPATTSSSDIRLPGDLRARYAVLITDDREARVNVNVTGNEANVGSHTSNEGWSTFEIDLSNIIELASTGNGIATASDIIDTRLGSDDAPGTSTTNDDTGIVPDPETDNIDNDGDWVTGNDTNGNGIPDSGETDVDEADEITDEPNEFNSISPYGDDVPFGLLSEAEIMGTSSYTSRLETIFNTRGVSENEQNSLNSWVTTYSADTILCPPYQLDGGTSTTKLNINALVNNEGKYNDGEAYYDTDKKAQMLVDVFTAGGVPDIERQQMAVNIIDFIDSDDTVSIYNDGTNDYYGIERTPYINEVDANPQAGDPESIELFNPYDTAITIGDWTITGPSLGTITITAGKSISARDYYVIADGGAADQIEAGMNLDNNGEELTLTTDPGSGSITVQVTDYGRASKQNSSQLNDPRPIPLSATAANPWYWETSLSSTIDAQNGNFRPEDGKDGWEDTTPTHWNSFFVANRRFSNIGYLGFIHKGSEWSSVRVGDTPGYPIDYPNLLDYITITDPSMDNIDNDGDGDIDTYDTDGGGDIDVNDTGDTGFQSGDLDGPEYRIPGLINVNTASTKVLQSLPNIDSTLGDAIDTPGNKPYTSIGDLVDKVTEITGTLPKWNEEESLRSISNLITTRSNVFTVYVTAQVTDEAMSNVFAEKKILAIVDRSIDPIKIRYFRWITE